MLNFLLFAAAAAAAQASDASTPPGPTATAFTISPPRSGDATHLLSIGTPPEHFLSIVCAPGHPQAEIYAGFPETIGFSVRAGNSGGFRVRYSFDGGEERRGDWSATGNTAIAMGRYSGSNDFLARMRGTHNVRLTVRRQGGGTQELSYAYPDPAPLVDELVRRCGLDLGR
jgi:hypothetical protein